MEIWSHGDSTYLFNRDTVVVGRGAMLSTDMSLVALLSTDIELCEDKTLSMQCLLFLADSFQTLQIKRNLQPLKGGRDIQKQLQEEVKLLKEEHPNFEPVLAIVQVGAREDSNVYIRMKKKVAAEVGVATKHVQLPRTLSESE
ncbi:hypothetical protein AVEN_173285-1, partial [Araneus ventricosus]